ncbi:MAG TPA: hypothetical protein VK308_06735 [Pyrinomonadaceae bacterium]|nr:hypothetical protein [Pyrinomonadaceae bacterium]
MRLAGEWKAKKDSLFASFRRKRKRAVGKDAPSEDSAANKKSNRGGNTNRLISPRQKN